MNNAESPFSIPPGRFTPAISLRSRPVVLFLFYVAVVFFLWAGFVPLATIWVRSVWSIPAGDFFQELFLFLGAFIPAVFLARMEGRPIGSFGLPVRANCWLPFCTGCLIGLAEISLLIASIAACGGYSFGTILLDGPALVEWAGYWTIFFLAVGFAEEFAFRGYSQVMLARSVGFWPAAMVLSAAFGAIHLTNPGESWVGIAGVVGTGLLLAFTLRRTGSLWLAVGWHAAFDFGETFLYSVPDSGSILPGHLSNASLHGPIWLTGGTVGPEGSLFSFLIMAAAALFIHKLFPAPKPAELAAVSAPGSAVSQ
jgi:membrane protease YdiL (CAAX protease family)